MCDAVLKFTIYKNVSHLSVWSREQMKKKLKCLLPITVAPDAHPEGRQTLPLTLNILPVFGIHWQTLIVPGTHLFLTPEAPQLVSQLIHISSICSIKPVLPHFIFENILGFSCYSERSASWDTQVLCITCKISSVPEEIFSHGERWRDCFRDSRRPPRQSVVSVTFIISWNKCITGDEQRNLLPLSAFSLLNYLYTYT